MAVSCMAISAIDSCRSRVAARFCFDGVSLRFSRQPVRVGYDDGAMDKLIRCARHRAHTAAVLSLRQCRRPQPLRFYKFRRFVLLNRCTWRGECQIYT